MMLPRFLTLIILGTCLFTLTGGCFTVTREPPKKVENEIVSEQNKDIERLLFKVDFEIIKNIVRARVSGNITTTTTNVRQVRINWLEHYRISIDDRFLGSCVGSYIIGWVVCPIIALLELPTLPFRSWDKSWSDEKEVSHEVTTRNREVSTNDLSLRFCGRLFLIINGEASCSVADFLEAAGSSPERLEILHADGSIAGPVEGVEPQVIANQIRNTQSQEKRIVAEQQRAIEQQRLLEEERQRDEAARKEAAERQRLAEEERQRQLAEQEKKKSEELGRLRAVTMSRQATIKANTVLSGAYRIVALLEESSKERFSRPAYSQRISIQADTEAKAIFRNGLVFDLAGWCAVKHDISGLLRSTCFPGLLNYGGSFDMHMEKTSQDLKERIEVIPGGNIFDVRVQISQSCMVFSCFTFTTFDGLQLHVRILSVSNIRTPPPEWPGLSEQQINMTPDHPSSDRTGDIRVTLQFVNESFLKWVADGNISTGVSIPVGETRILEAKNRLEITVGNAGGVRIIRAGVQPRILGPPNRIVKIIYNLIPDPLNPAILKVNETIEEVQ